MAQHRRGRLLAIESDVVCVCVRPHVVKEEGETWTAFLPLATHTLTYRLLIIRQVLSSSINRKTAAARRRVPFVAYYIPSSHILFFFALFFSTCRHDLVSCARTKLYGDPVACSTTTVTKCQAGLRTLQAFPVFHPTCLCREPSVDPDCNAFRDSLFDHPCMVSKQKGNTVTCLSLCWPAFID